MLKQLIMPGFLARIDKDLLLKYPLIWSSRVHFVAWYTALVWLCMLALGMVMNGHTLNSNFLGFYWLLSVLCMLAGIIIWLVYLLRHNSTKQYGQRSVGREWINMFWQFICLVLITSCMHIMPAVQVFKAHLEIQQNNWVEKINTLNLNSAFFPENEYDLQQMYSPMDTLQYTVVSYKLGGVGTYGDDDYSKFDNRFLDYQTLQEKFYAIHGKDSINKAIGAYLAVLKSLNLEHPYSQNKIAALVDDTLAYKRDKTFEAINASISQSLHYRISPIFRPISKFDYLLEGGFYFVWLFVVLPIFLLLLTIFRNTPLKFFLVSLAVTIALIIINSIFIGILYSDYENEIDNLFVLAFVIGSWTIVFLVLATRVFVIKNYKLVNAYAVIVLNLLIPILPLVYTALIISYYEYLHYSYQSLVGDALAPNPYPNISNSSSDTWYMTASAFGLFLIVLLQQLYFKPLYERLWALPK